MPTEGDRLLEDFWRDDDHLDNLRKTGAAQPALGQAQEQRDATANNLIDYADNVADEEEEERLRNEHSFDLAERKVPGYQRPDDWRS